MKLLAYKINGQTINVDIFNWSTNQLNGNQPWVVQDTVPTDYADVSSIISWYEIGFGIKDYLYVRERIREFYTQIEFANLSEQEKVIVCQLFIATKAERNSIFTEEYQKEYWNMLVEQSQYCRFKRWESVKKYISYKLTPTDSSNLANDTSTLCSNYINYNITDFAKDGIAGLFDYLQGTGSYTSTGYPSKGYWLQADQSVMMDILQNGV